MNKRMIRQKENDEKNNGKKKFGNKKVAGGIMLCVFIFVFSMQISRFGYKQLNKSETAEAEKGEDIHEVVTEDESWKLVLVNDKNHLDKEFRVSLQAVDGGKVDARIVPPLLQMISDAKAEGVALTVCSAYRNVGKQETLFAQEINKYTDKGYNEEESLNMAKRYVNPPGASEHHTGLAIDFLTDNITQLEESFADTSAYTWLKANALNYGFIERYPEGKEEVTGIFWEPWHYRYVGVKNARDILKNEACLEEYIDENKKQ